MMNNEIQKLEQAIQALQAQRAILGDDVVDVALGPLQEKLQSLKNAPAAFNLEFQQRRVVSVLFANVSGYTSLSENVDAEDVRDLMNSLWESLDAIIFKQGGKIDKHMGNGVMALWGADGAREDDTERAIRAALQMQEALSAQNSEKPIRLRVGISTGPVLLGSVGSSGEITALGDTVNIASRLEQVCPVGKILVSRETYTQVRGVFNVEEGPLEYIKGSNEPVETYLVTAVKPRAFRLYTRGIEGMETRMVGRQAELDLLKKAFQEMIGKQGPRHITICGDAGVGKSRLLYEFNAWAEIQGDMWWVFKGRASQATQQTPYALLRNVFSLRFEIRDSDSRGLAHHKLINGLKEFLQNDPAWEKKTAIIGHLLGLDFSDNLYVRALLKEPEQLRRQALFYITQFFQAAAARYPVLLMLDDLQWADASSLDSLSTILNNLPAQADLLSILVTRPDIYERNPDWGENLQNHTRCTLSPLNIEESQALVGEILRKVDSLPDELKIQLAQHGAGNPFYMEELIKMLIDRQIILPDQETWTVSIDQLEKMELPSTLAEVLQARLDSLTLRERMTLQRASAVGRIFWDTSIIELLPDLPSAEIYTILQSLQRKEIIFERHPSAFQDAREYTFKHSLMHEVVYDTLLKRQRILLHTLVAHWLYRISGERRSEYLSQIAEQYEKGEEPIRTAEITAQAAENALRISALTEARTFFQRALDMLSQSERPKKPILEIILMHLGEAKASALLGDLSRAQASASQANELAREQNYKHLMARALAQLGQIASDAGNNTLSRDYLTQALAMARQEQNLLVTSKNLFLLSEVEWRLGNLEHAQSYAEESRQIAIQTGDHQIETKTNNRLGALETLRNNLETAEKHYQQSLRIAQDIGRRHQEAIILNHLGTLAGMQNQWSKAQEYYRQGLENALEIGSQPIEALSLLHLGLSDIHLSRNTEARKRLRQSTLIGQKIGAQNILVLAVVYYGIWLVSQDQPARAKQFFTLAKQQPAWNGEINYELQRFLANWELPPPQTTPTLTWDQAIQELIGE